MLGGNPIGTTGGDSLTVNSAATMTVTAGPENDAGSVDAATTTPTNVSFDEIEVLIIGGGGGGVINGTNGNDAITVIARDDSFNAAADGVQDFTAVVNAGLEILFLNQPTLTVNALGGSDTIVVRTPAPNNAVWDVDVTVDGGTPSAGDPVGQRPAGRGNSGCRRRDRDLHADGLGCRDAGPHQPQFADHDQRHRGTALRR